MRPTRLLPTVEINSSPNSGEEILACRNGCSFDGHVRQFQGSHRGRSDHHASRDKSIQRALLAGQLLLERKYASGLVKEVRMNMITSTITLRGRDWISPTIAAFNLSLSTMVVPLFLCFRRQKSRG